MTMRSFSLFGLSRDSLFKNAHLLTSGGRDEIGMTLSTLFAHVLQTMFASAKTVIIGAIAKKHTRNLLSKVNE